jgi:hypothetical protein
MVAMQCRYDDEIMVERVPKMAPRSRMIAELMEMRDGGEQVVGIHTSPILLRMFFTLKLVYKGMLPTSGLLY